MTERILYKVSDAAQVLVQLIPYLSSEKLDEIIALYCHGNFGNVDDVSAVESTIREGARRIGLPPLRERVFQLWKRIYRRSDISRQEFILRVQHEERKAFGSNQLADMLRRRQVSKK